MSVRNTKAALSDMDPISVGFRGNALPDYEPQREVRNTRAALSSMRPLSIPHERYRNDSRQKVALCDLEPLSVGVAFSPSLDDESSENSGRHYRYDLEANYRKAKDDTANNVRQEVNMDEMLRAEREKNLREQREKTQQEGSFRKQLTNEEEERVRRMREARLREEEQRRIQENERVRRMREEQRQRAIELGERERAPDSSDRSRDRDGVAKPVYYGLSLLCICMICLLLGACLGVGIWALLEYVVLKEENTPAPVITPTSGPADRPPSSPVPAPSAQRKFATRTICCFPPKLKSDDFLRLFQLQIHLKTF